MRRSRLTPVVFAALVGVALLACWRWKVASRELFHQQVVRTKGTMEQLAVEVLALKSRNGAVPTSEEELVKVLGRSLPNTAWDTEISYAYTNGQFFIRALSPYPELLIFEFNSMKADTGVSVYPF
jgi:hypothetical protein